MTTWYYGQGGNNSNDGLSYAQRKLTYANFSASIAAGDTIYICASSSAATWTNTEQINIVGGSVGSVVTYMVYPGHSVLMDVSIGGELGAINGNGDNYFRIEPGDGYLELGDPDEWEPRGANGGLDFSASRQLNFANCTHFELIGTGTGDFDTTDSNFLVHGGNAWVGNYFDVDCEDYIVSGIDWSMHGSNNTNVIDHQEEDWGDLVVFGGLRSLIEYNTWRWGGHVTARFMGRSQIVQYNDADGDWTGVTPNSDAGRGAPIERSGQRCFSCYSGVDDDEGTEASPYGPVMYQHNILRNAGSADEPDNCGAEINAQHFIVRFNYVWDGCDALFKSSSFPSFLSVGNQKIYNNTGYGNGRIIDLRTTTVTDDVLIRVDVINNIFDEMPGSYYGVALVKHFRRQATGEDAEGFANEWKGGRYEANIAKMQAGSPDGTSVTIDLRSFAGSTTFYTWTTIDNAYPSNWTSDNVMGTSPTYLGNPASGARTKNTFIPNGGIETGNAKPHAYANGGGTITTALVVDAGQNKMFCDGWGMEDLGVEADWIKIGSGDPVQISACNSNGTGITLAHVRTWSDNDEIYLCLTNDGINFTIVQDIGAGQTAGTVVPIPDPEAPVHSTKVMVFR
jgi:hypothetical protein